MAGFEARNKFVIGLVIEDTTKVFAQLRSRITKLENEINKKGGDGKRRRGRLTIGVKIPDEDVKKIKQFGNVLNKIETPQKKFNELTKAIQDTNKELSKFISLASKISKQDIAKSKAVKKPLKSLGVVEGLGIGTIDREYLRATRLSKNEFSDVLRRVSLWSSASMMIFSGVRSFRSEMKKALNLTDQLIEFQKIIGNTVPLQKLRVELKNVAIEYSQNVEEVTEIARTWAQQGYGWRQSLELTRSTLKGVNSTLLETADAVEFLTSIMRSFNLTIGETNSIWDKIMEVQRNYAIMSQELAEGLRFVASIGYQLGEDIDSLLGYITAIKEVTRDTGKQTGQALKTIFSRLYNPEIIQYLKDLGIATEDIRGGRLQPRFIFHQIRAKVQSGEIPSRMLPEIAKQIAGVRKYREALILLQRLDVAEEVRKRSLMATNVALEASELEMQKFQRRALQLGAIWSGLADILFTKGELSFVSFLSESMDVLAKVGKAVYDLAKRFDYLGNMLSNLLTVTVVAGLGGLFSKEFRRITTGRTMQSFSQAASLYQIGVTEEFDKLFGMRFLKRAIGDPKLYRMVADDLRRGLGLAFEEAFQRASKIKGIDMKSAFLTALPVSYMNFLMRLKKGGVEYPIGEEEVFKIKEISGLNIGRKTAFLTGLEYSFGEEIRKITAFFGGLKNLFTSAAMRIKAINIAAALKRMRGETAKSISGVEKVAKIQKKAAQDTGKALTDMFKSLAMWVSLGRIVGSIGKFAIRITWVTILIEIVTWITDKIFGFISKAKKKFDRLQGKIDVSANTSQELIARFDLVGQSIDKNLKNYESISDEKKIKIWIEKINNFLNIIRKSPPKNIFDAIKKMNEAGINVTLENYSETLSKMYQFMIDQLYVGYSDYLRKMEELEREFSANLDEFLNRSLNEPLFGESKSTFNKWGQIFFGRSGVKLPEVKLDKKVTTVYEDFVKKTKELYGSMPEEDVKAISQELSDVGYKSLDALLSGFKDLSYDEFLTQAEDIGGDLGKLLIKALARAIVQQESEQALEDIDIKKTNKGIKRDAKKGVKDLQKEITEARKEEIRKAAEKARVPREAIEKMFDFGDVFYGLKIDVAQLSETLIRLRDVFGSTIVSFIKALDKIQFKGMLAQKFQFGFDPLEEIKNTIGGLLDEISTQAAEMEAKIIETQSKANIVKKYLKSPELLDRFLIATGGNIVSISAQQAKSVVKELEEGLDISQILEYVKVGKIQGISEESTKQLKQYLSALSTQQAKLKGAAKKELAVVVSDWIKAQIESYLFFGEMFKDANLKVIEEYAKKVGLSLDIPKLKEAVRKMRSTLPQERAAGLEEIFKQLGPLWDYVINELIGRFDKLQQIDVEMNKSQMRIKSLFQTAKTIGGGSNIFSAYADFIMSIELSTEKLDYAIKKANTVFANDTDKEKREKAIIEAYGQYLNSVNASFENARQQVFNNFMSNLKVLQKQRGDVRLLKGREGLGRFSDIVEQIINDANERLGYINKFPDILDMEATDTIEKVQEIANNMAIWNEVMDIANVRLNQIKEIMSGVNQVSDVFVSTLRDMLGGNLLIDAMQQRGTFTQIFKDVGLNLRKTLVGIWFKWSGLNFRNIAMKILGVTPDMIKTETEKQIQALQKNTQAIYYLTRQIMESELQRYKKEGDEKSAKELSNQISSINKLAQENLASIVEGGVSTDFAENAQKLIDDLTNKIKNGNTKAVKESLKGLAIASIPLVFAGLNKGKEAQTIVAYGSLGQSIGNALSTALSLSNPVSALVTAGTTILGSIFGSMIAPKRDKQDEQLEELRKIADNTAYLKELDERIINAPPGFAIPSRAMATPQIGQIVIQISGAGDPEQIANKVMQKIENSFSIGSTIPSRVFGGL